MDIGFDSEPMLCVFGTIAEIGTEYSQPELAKS